MQCHFVVVINSPKYSNGLYYESAHLHSRNLNLIICVFKYIKFKTSVLFRLTNLLIPKSLTQMQASFFISANSILGIISYVMQINKVKKYNWLTPIYGMWYLKLYVKIFNLAISFRRIILYIKDLYNFSFFII